MQDSERLLAHAFAQARIEAREGLVHEKHARPRRDRAGERHALLLATGEDMRVFIGVIGEADAGQRGKGLAVRLAAGERAEPEGDVLLDGEVRKQREVLKHQPDASLLGWNELVRSRRLLAVEQNAAGGRALDAGGDP